MKDVTRSVLTRQSVRRVLKLTLDIAVACGALLTAVYLRYGGYPPAELLDGVPLLCLLAVAIKLGALWTAGDYLRLWRFTSLREAVVLAVAIVGSAFAFVVLNLLDVIVMPKSIILIDAAFTLLGMAAVRGLRRVLDPVLIRRNRQHDLGDDSASPSPVRTLILGAGRTANALLTELQAQKTVLWDVVGILDDDASKQGERLRGVRVLGTTAELEQVLRRLGAAHVIIAIPTLQAAVVRSLIARAQSCGVSVQSVPTLDARWSSNGPIVGDAVKLTDLLDSAEVKRSLLPRIRKDRAVPTVLVTGGAGYIGSHLVRRLLAQGKRVRVLDSLLYGDDGLQAVAGHPNLELVKGDISSLRDVVSSVKDADAVIALAAIVGDPACGLDAEETLTLNFESTKILVEVCNFYGVSRLLFASSCSVYGASQDELLTETSPLNPVSLYARTRIMSEQVLRERSGDVKTTVLRLSTVFGLSPRMRFDLVANILVARAMIERRIVINGGDQWRPFVHCDDVASAFAAVLDADESLVAGETFNVGATHMNYTLATLGAIVADRIGNDVEVRHGEFNDDRRNYRVSFDKIASRLSWKPRYSLEAGIDELAEALRRQPHLRDFQQRRFSNLMHFRDHLEAAGKLSATESPARPIRTA